MEIDSDFLEVNVEDNEFDSCVSDAAGHGFAEDQKMDTALAEETSTKLAIECKGNKEDLRMKIQQNRQKRSEMSDYSRDTSDKVRRETRRKRGNYLA